MLQFVYILKDPTNNNED